jgi:hypothetical protein
MTLEQPVEDRRRGWMGANAGDRRLRNKSEE